MQGADGAASRFSRQGGVEVGLVRSVLVALGAMMLAALFLFVSLRGLTVEKAREQAEAARQAGDYQAARAALESAIALAPGAAEAWLDLGTTERAMWVIGRQAPRLRSALAAYERAGRLDDASAQPQLELARTLSLAGRNAAADRAYLRALDRDPQNVGMIIDRAQALERAGQSGRALSEYRRAASLEANPYSNDAERRLGGKR